MLLGFNINPEMQGSKLVSDDIARLPKNKESWVDQQRFLRHHFECQINGDPDRLKPETAVFEKSLDILNRKLASLNAK